MLHRLTRPAVAVAFAAGLSAAAFARPPFDFDSAAGRLPKSVVPLDYRIAIVPDAASRTLTGSETIVVQVRKPVAAIVFNSLNERLRDVTLDGAPVRSVKSDDAAQLTTLELARPAPVGRHTLEFAYSGKLESAPQGLFVQPYRTPDGAGGTMLSTQFEATDARRMFPCWDEPAFRATFQLTVTLPAAWSTVSNMPPQSRAVHGALATTAFRRSPKMPTYLVELSAGDLAHIDASARGRRLGIWAVRGQERDGAYALANAQQILADYEAYFDYPYPLPKLDSIAVPGGFQGAMENWGAITYNDQALLLPPGSTLERRQRVFSIQAHEMAHQWNGDLVTMGWWDDIWLNESFATWMAAKETALRNPSWNWWEHQDEPKERAMDADAHASSHPIEQHVVNELDAEASFDPAITYNKGHAFLRMLEHYLGESTFRAGVRSYVRARAYSNATSGDLWHALSAASGQDVERIASGWTTQPGFPVVGVRAACDAAGNRTIALTQRRFLFEGADVKTRWRIPMDVRSGARAPQRVLLAADGQAARAGRCDEPLSANAGDVGFYRVAYDQATLALNTTGFRGLPEADKIALLDDQWALAQANQPPLGSYLALVSAMGDDLDARAWETIVAALGAIEVDERGTPGHDAFVAYARAAVRPVLGALGWDAKPNESPATQKLRRDAIQELGVWGDPEVVAEARRRFEQFATDRGALGPDDQVVVLTVVAANADRAAFDRVHAIAKTAREEGEVRRYYTALAAVRDPQLAAQALDILMSSELPPQAAGARERIVLDMIPNNPQLVWRFYQAHGAELLASRSEFERALAIAEVPGKFWQAAPLNEIEAFVKAHVPPNAGTYVARGMERARFGLALKQRLVPAADAYVAAHRHDDAATGPAGRVANIRSSPMSRQLALFASAASPLRLVGDRGDVTYVPEFIDRALADALVRELNADTRWRADSRMMYGRRVLVPRETAGRGEKMAQPWTPALSLVREMAERHTGTAFDYCFLNRYRDGNDAVAWHGDRDGTRDARLVVASLSLGATRTFQLRPKKDSGLRHDPVSVDVAHGDLIVMAGDTQLYWEHRVPRDPRVTGERLNVTFRQHRARDERKR